MFPLWVEQSRGGELLRSPSKKTSFFQMRKNLEAKIRTLEKMFKSLVSSGQILDSLYSSRAQAISSTPDYYMFGASEKVVNSAAVIGAQIMLRATLLTTIKSMDSLQARDNGPAD